MLYTNTIFLLELHSSFSFILIKFQAFRIRNNTVYRNTGYRSYGNMRQEPRQRLRYTRYELWSYLIFSRTFDKLLRSDFPPFPRGSRNPTAIRPCYAYATHYTASSYRATILRSRDDRGHSLLPSPCEPHRPNLRLRTHYCYCAHPAVLLREWTVGRLYCVYCVVRR